MLSHILYVSITSIIAISAFSPINNNHSYTFMATPMAYAEPVPDDNGVIMYKYDGIPQNVYNPLILASWGLSYHAEYENTGDEQSREYFVNTADWLVDNL